ncbi:MAG: DUF1365 domain-containing protein [Rhodospirillales bacterium]
MSRGTSALFAGEVMHRRLKPLRHRLAYRMCYFLLDLDEVAELDRNNRLFGYNRRALFSFREADHGNGDSQPGALRNWIDTMLTDNGMEAGGRVSLLCLPRLFGYAFNPLTVWFCHRRDGSLQAILYEVRNTFRQKHHYLIPVSPDEAAEANGMLRQRADKAFYVSPFIEMEQTYQFRVRLPEKDRIAVAIRESNPTGPLLHAAFSGIRREITDRALASVALAFPFMTLKVIAGIHWEALKLWFKGAAYVARPAPPESTVSIGSGEIS